MLHQQFTFSGILMIFTIPFKLLYLLYVTFGYLICYNCVVYLEVLLVIPLIYIQFGNEVKKRWFLNMLGDLLIICCGTHSLFRENLRLSLWDYVWNMLNYDVSGETVIWDCRKKIVRIMRYNKNISVHIRMWILKVEFKHLQYREICWSERVIDHALLMLYGFGYFYSYSWFLILNNNFLKFSVLGGWENTVPLE